VDVIWKKRSAVEPAGGDTSGGSMANGGAGWTTSSMTEATYVMRKRGGVKLSDWRERRRREVERTGEFLRELFDLMSPEVQERLATQIEKNERKEAQSNINDILKKGLSEWDLEKWR